MPMEDGGKDATRSAEEEAIKRSTDCVYFLASPLTCKKGVECEYRHSEGARVNPRDCWFWLNGNCLNAKCSFRHPPLDGLIGTPTTPGPAPPAHPKVPTQAQASSAQLSATQNPNKQGVPCYYFQRGGCLKGDKCPFSHGSTPLPNPVLQQAPKVNTTFAEPSQSMKKTSWTLDKTSQQNTLKETSSRPIQAATSSNKSLASVDTSADNGIPTKEFIQPIVEFTSRSKIISVPPGGNNALSRSHGHQLEPLEDELQNDKEGDEYLRESSPGFDVLVDDETEDPGYFCDEDEFGGASGHDGRNLNPATDFDYHHSSDYEAAAKVTREPFEDASEYDHHGLSNDYYARNHPGDFSDRAVEKRSASDRRTSRREDNLSVIDGSDLRHQLMKKRRINESRSGTSPDPRDFRRADENRLQEQRYLAHGRRNDPRSTVREVSTGKRLQGRISMPRVIPADNGDRHSDRDIDRGRRGRLSPGSSTNFQSRRLHDRLNRKSSERLEERNFGTPSVRSDVTGGLDFAGPKSLSELKSKKHPHASEKSFINSSTDNLSEDQRSLKLGKALNRQDTEPIPFEGPQPLSIILKRKREATSASNSNERRNGEIRDSVTVTSAAAIGSVIAGRDEEDLAPEVVTVDIVEEEQKTTDADGPFAEGHAIEIEDGLEYNEEEGEYEYYEQVDGGYEEGEEYGEYEAEGGDGDGETLYEVAEEEDEGDDDFAKKLAMYN